MPLALLAAALLLLLPAGEASAQACGDGTLDGGEQCDLGAANGTPIVCCTISCTFVLAGTECRAAADVCDVAETCTGSSDTCPADGFEPGTTECRAAAGVCDVAESCTGTGVACPADGFEPGTTQCRTSAGSCDLIEFCTGAGAACPSDGFLAVGTLCRASAGVCDDSEFCTGSSAACPVDGFEPATTECRASAGPCDLAENCTGTSGSCPANAKSTGECRAAAGPCDDAELCDGVSDFCPADGKSTAECRPAADACDLAEVCDGVSNTCPSDAFEPATTECRASGGFCDVAESCTGSGIACPADAFEPVTTECRASAGACDPAENCTGADATCPADVLEPATTECRASAGACDLAESCTGADVNCPADLKSTAQCRATAGACDPAEICDGVGDACPADALSPGGTECRAAAGSCDVAETCTGSSPACPADGFELATTECRPSAGLCDIAENCSGSSAACPTDAFELATLECRPSAGICDVPESCTGSSAACPSDAFEPLTTECRASTAVCDAAENCTGASAACPADGLEPATTQCRASAGLCDIAESCTGASTTCPADLLRPALSPCRVAASDCDVEEVCTGASSTCPTDILEPDGTLCDDANFCTINDMCASGSCVGDPGGASPATCGDTVLQATCGEQCDDGNGVDCDGCSSSCQIENPACGVQSVRQQACIRAMNKSLGRVSKAQGNDVLRCIADGAKDRLGTMTIDECVMADRADKVARAQLNTQLQEIRKCQVEPPDFGATDAATVNDTGISSELSLVTDVLGPDLESAIVPTAVDAPAYRCQRAVIGAVEKCRRAKISAFNRCKGTKLKKGQDGVLDVMSLRACLDDDLKGRVERRCDPVTGRLRTTALRRCLGTDLSTVFPLCNTDDAAELAACLDPMVECRACLSLAEADDFGPAICDLFDNFAQDGSCGALPPAGQCGPGSHWIDGPCDAGLDVLVGSTAAVGIDLDSDCIADLSVVLSGDVILQRSAPLDQSVHFPGATDCGGSPCGQADAHLDVIDTEILSMTLSAPDVLMTGSDASSVPLTPSIGTLVEKLDPTLGESFFDVFLEVRVSGTLHYNHTPLRLEADLTRDPPEATYVSLPSCLPLFDDPLGGLRNGSLVDLTLTTNRCAGNLAGLDDDGDLDGATACIDCDDADPAIFPGAVELCDSIDNDCDGSTDEPFDLDLDGVTTCAGDCDDTNPAMFPGGVEVCDGFDNDCNSLVDDDQDSDGLGPCAGDCDESDPAVNPFASEVCGDGIDNNCNGQVDEFCP